MKKILISNDDGIHSEGIRVLADALEPVGEVWVVAPDRERSAASHSLTLHRPLRARKVSDRWYSVDGTPTDCITLAIHGILHCLPDIVISGINKGGNLGDDISYSGTVSAAMEGTLFGVDSFAISLVGDGDYNFKPAVDFAKRLTIYILEQGLPKDSLLNVNVPNVKDEGEIKGYRITRQGRRFFEEDLIVEKVDPRGKKYYWIGGNSVRWVEDADSDYAAVKENYISITPIHLDLTNYDAIKELRDMDI